MTKDRQKVQVNLKKAHSLLAKIIEMIEEDKYCIDIMQQNLAVMGLLKSVHKEIMETHLNSCFKHAMETASEKKKQEMIEEILKVTDLSNRR